MTCKVFISYRRNDSAGYAGRVHDRLELEFGRNHLFMDVDGIPLGANFMKVLGEKVAQCDVLLALIGPGWLDARDENGNRRLDNPDDPVRIEIGTALRRDIPVIPILLEGTRVPKALQLPGNLKELSVRNGLDIRHASFASDLQKLIHVLKAAKSPRKTAPAAPATADCQGTRGNIKVNPKTAFWVAAAAIGIVVSGMATYRTDVPKTALKTAPATYRTAVPKTALETAPPTYGMDAANAAKMNAAILENEKVKQDQEEQALKQLNETVDQLNSPSIKHIRGG